MIRAWLLRRKLRSRAGELAEIWMEQGIIYGDGYAGNRRGLTRIIYETLCSDHGVRP